MPLLRTSPLTQGLGGGRLPAGGRGAGPPPCDRARWASRAPGR